MSSTLSLPYIQARTMAAHLRKELKAKWPQVSWSVTTSHGSSLNIQWTDGPARAEVEVLADPLRGADWDGHQDMYITRQNVMFQGQRVRSLVQGISYNRSYSPAFLNRVLEKWKNHEGFEELEILERDGHAHVSVRSRANSAATAVERWIRDDLYNTSAFLQETAPDLTTIALTIDEGKGLINLNFPTKPTEEIRAEMKQLGWRWYGKLGVWYNKHTPENLQYAEALIARLTAVRTDPESLETTSLLQEAHADLLEAEAIRMQPKIDKLSVPAFANQNVTPRRAEFRRARMQERDHEQRIQNFLLKLASLTRSGELPQILQKVTKVRHVRELLRPIVYEEKNYVGALDFERMDKDLLLALGLDTRNWLDAVQAVKALDAGDPGAVARAMVEKEDRLRTSKIPGFFPTPAALVEEMLVAADISDHHTVLEPSAGRGDIADRIREQCPKARLVCVELNHTLAEILHGKGHTVEQTDFLQHQGEYHRILMNPPFEKGQDIQHIQHAYTLLARGGILVAICSEGPFGRQDRQSAQFREWLDQVYAEVTELPEGSFTGKDAFRQTGVRTRMVVITK